MNEYEEKINTLLQDYNTNIELKNDPTNINQK